MGPVEAVGVVGVVEPSSVSGDSAVRKTQYT